MLQTSMAPVNNSFFTDNSMYIQCNNNIGQTKSTNCFPLQFVDSSTESVILALAQ